MTPATDMSPISLVSHAAEARVVRLCSEHFSGLPNGVPLSADDLLSLLVLATQHAPIDDPDPHIVGARVQLVRLGLNHAVVLDLERRLALFHLAAWRLAGEADVVLGDALRGLGVDPRQGARQIWKRCLQLWSQACEIQEIHAEECAQIATELGHLLPPGLSLMEHQLEAVRFGRACGYRLLLLDEQGLGKTIETIAMMLMRGAAAFPALIVSPVSVVFKWQREVEKWMPRRNPVVRQLDAKTDWEEIKYLVDSKEPLVMAGSWGQLVKYHGALREMRLGTLVGDESHYLANWDSQRTQAFIRVRSTASSVLGLTGTMMPNGRHAESYAQVKSVAPDAFNHLLPGNKKKGDRRFFLRTYCGPSVKYIGGKDKKGKPRSAMSYDGRSNDLDFGRILTSFAIRRTKAQVFGPEVLPPLTRYAVPVPISPASRMKLLSIKDNVRERLLIKASELEARMLDQGVPAHKVIQQVQRVIGSQAVSELSEMRTAVGLLKVDWCVSRVREHVREGHRVVLFCWHYPVQDRLALTLRKALGDDKVLVGRGDSTAQARGRLIDRAQDGDGDVLVLTSAYKEGIDLTAFSRLIMSERWWVPGDESQAEARIHRPGQLLPTAVVYPMIEGSSDDAMASVQVWKEQGQQQSQGSAELRAYQWLLATETA